MPGRIQLLSDEVIGKIAAGEVVERPAAAIKEMVENSLDAGATAVTVEIRDGGISYFRVTDNGSGIMQSEIRMAFERHATSKITNAQDLFAIRTLGFRGEALASIAAVAHVTCTTRTKADVSGIRVKNSGGRIESIEEAACPEGTTFVVKDLFYNTPVRLKFLKKPATEAGYVSDLMMRLILSRPDVSFRYISQGKTLYHSAGDGKLASAVFSIYGKDVRAMKEVSGHQGGVLINGFVGVGDCARGSRGHQSFFINGRYMKSGLLSASVEAACRELVAPGKFPVCVLHMTMPYDTVDVNVHPNKLEVRFQNDQAVSEAVESIVRGAVERVHVLDKPAEMQLAPQVQTSAPVVIRKQEATVVPPASAAEKKTESIQEKKAEAVSAAGLSAGTAAPVIPVQPAEEKKPEPPVQKQQHAQVPPVVRPAMKVLQPLTPQARPVSPVLREAPVAVQTYLQSFAPPVQPVPPQRPEGQKRQEASDPVQVQSFLVKEQEPLRIIGTVFNSYILVEYKDSLVLVDQQGVHERILFDRMMKELDTQTCGQELLIPMIMQVTRREQQLLEEHREMLASLGLTVEAFGENEVSIRSIPMILGQPQAGEILREVIDQLESERGVVSMEKRRRGILALACRKAVKGGEKLSESDIRELVSRMVNQNITPASPRGTPLVVALTHSDIDRRFRRMQ